MSKSAVVIDRDYLKHMPGEGHPERPQRIKVLLDLAEGLDAGRFQLLPPRAATRSEVELVHTSEHVRLVEATSQSNRYALDGDTITCRDSFGVGLLAAGGFLTVLDAIAAGEANNGFALVRPPGHHALSGRAMGFCLFNTMAIGAEYLKRVHGVERVLVMDWDVHHGNGTQGAFFEDPCVLFVSTHQFPFYPGSGAVNEVGAGTGEGYTLNVPLPAGCGDAEYLQVFREIVVPAAEKFAPQWILVSAGFDPHRRDPLGGMGVTERGFAAMAERLCELAECYSGSRIAFLLEGGYDLAALKDSVSAVLAAMQDRPAPASEPLAKSPSVLDPLLRRIRQVHEKYR
jgi:acetoin utilization deacetylase AcuC-like enzyme